MFRSQAKLNNREQDYILKNADSLEIFNSRFNEKSHKYKNRASAIAMLIAGLGYAIATGILLAKYGAAIISSISAVIGPFYAPVVIIGGPIAVIMPFFPVIYVAAIIGYGIGCLISHAIHYYQQGAEVKRLATQNKSNKSTPAIIKEIINNRAPVIELPQRAIFNDAPAPAVDEVPPPVIFNYAPAGEGADEGLIILQPGLPEPQQAISAKVMDRMNRLTWLNKIFSKPKQHIEGYEYQQEGQPNLNYR